jgi:hypothetical protein
MWPSTSCYAGTSTLPFLQDLILLPLKVHHHSYLTYFIHFVLLCRPTKCNTLQCYLQLHPRLIEHLHYSSSTTKDIFVPERYRCVVLQRPTEQRERHLFFYHFSHEDILSLQETFRYNYSVKSLDSCRLIPQCSGRHLVFVAISRENILFLVQTLKYHFHLIRSRLISIFLSFTIIFYL